MSVVEKTIRQAIENKGVEAEKQARIEVRVNFAREILVPSMARFSAEKSAYLKPLLSGAHKALGYDLTNVCGEKFSKEVNLGGLFVRPSVTDYSVIFNIFGSYNPIDSTLKTILAFNPVTHMDVDIFTSTKTITGKMIPEIEVESGSAVINSCVYLEVLNTDRKSTRLNSSHT